MAKNELAKNEPVKNEPVKNEPAKNELAEGERPDSKAVDGILTRMRQAPRHVSIPVGLALVVGGTVLAPLPIFGVWMLPVGVAILAPHSRRARWLSRRMRWVSLRALHWSIRYGFVRVKHVERKEDGGVTPSDG